jgi:SsrA-binding protein
MAKVLIKNKEAAFHYEILERYEAGIELKGFEVKSLISGKGSLKGAYVSNYGGELFLVKAHIPPYQEKNAPPDYDPERPRKLLLKRREINYLIGKIKEKRLTLIPLSIILKNRLIKVELGLARGLKKYEKKEKIKKRDFEREKRRELKNLI